MLTSIFTTNVLQYLNQSIDDEFSLFKTLIDNEFNCKDNIIDCFNKNELDFLLKNS